MFAGSLSEHGEYYCLEMLNMTHIHHELSKFTEMHIDFTTTDVFVIWYGGFEVYMVRETPAALKSRLSVDNSPHVVNNDSSPYMNLTTNIRQFHHRGEFNNKQNYKLTTNCTST